MTCPGVPHLGHRHDDEPCPVVDARGKEEVNPHEGLLIDRFGVTAKYKARCACCPEHRIASGDTIARAVQEDGSGLKDFGWVCPECTDKIAYPEHTG